MPPGRPAAGPSTTVKKSLIGDALYEWAREHQEAGYVFQQQELLDSGLIPNNDLTILLEGLNYLLSRHLFKAHDIKGSHAAGYELVEEAAAANYDKLTSDEKMVYSSIDSAGTQGIWTKTIKAKSGVHAKVLDRVYKSLENRGLIKPMKSVKHPQRKMYIRAELTPSEEATGGTWFNDGRLDIGMIEAVTSAIEAYCSFQSWRIVEEDADGPQSNGMKRKQPDDGFDETGKGKGKKTENGRIETGGKQKHPQYELHPPGYQGYPTLNDFSRELREKSITQLAIPNNAIQQVLDIMVYDEKLCRLSRLARLDEAPEDPNEDVVFMYRCLRNPFDLGQNRSRQRKIVEDQSYSAMRSQELEDIGRGGFSEVPCMDCPVFDICGDGGPVNVKTCEYLQPWREKMERADMEAGDPWPQIQNARRVRPKG